MLASGILRVNTTRERERALHKNKLFDRTYTRMSNKTKTALFGVALFGVSTVIEIYGSDLFCSFYVAAKQQRYKTP